MVTYFDDLAVEALDFMTSTMTGSWSGFESAGARRAVGSEPPPRVLRPLVEIRDGKIARAVEYQTLAEAVEAASAVAGASVEDH
jgi:hypothetical protein